MAALKVKFDWSSLDRYAIIHYMMELAPNIVGHELPIDKFHLRLVNHLRKFAPLKFRKTKDVKVKSNQVWLGGCYYSDLDQEKQKAIELMMVYPLFDETIKISKKRFRDFCSLTADTILHEMMHMRQYRRRKFKALNDYDSDASRINIRLAQEYYGCPDEIDAYSFNIACELYDKFKGNYLEIVEYLNEDQKRKQRKYNSWRTYLKVFQHNHSHQVIQKLKKRVIKYIPKAEIGKPYTNKDWINC